MALGWKQLAPVARCPSHRYDGPDAGSVERTPAAVRRTDQRGARTPVELERCRVGPGAQLAAVSGARHRGLRCRPRSTAHVRLRRSLDPARTAAGARLGVERPRLAAARLVGSVSRPALSGGRAIRLWRPETAA